MTHISRRDEDRNFILNSSGWPAWPCLPVKRLDNSLKNKNLGIILDSEGHPIGKIRIYHVYLFDLPKKGWKDVPYTEYDSVDSMLDDKWMVD